MSRPFRSSRRRVLAGGAAAALSAAGGVFGGVPTGDGTRRDRGRVSLGFIPLTDCAPLVVAQERGFFAEQGLDVTLSREPSWAAIRDKVVTGALDGAQMLAGMPVAASLGVGGFHHPMVTALSLGLNGNAITVSDALYARMCEADPAAMAERPVSARALKAVIDADRRDGLAPLTFASVYPVSSHNFQLRYWLADAGIDPDEDVRLIVIPPARMSANLAADRIAGYCVGEPWNEFAVAAGTGHALVTSYELWNNGPEKVLGVTREWADRNPDTHAALLRALIAACAWLDGPGHRAEVAELLAAPAYVDAPASVIRRGLTGQFQHHHGGRVSPLPDFNVFHRYAANFPWPSHAVWFITQMLRWGQLTHAVDTQRAATEVYRTDIYRQAAASLGIPAPAEDFKTEGGHAHPWTLETPDGAVAMGPDRFIDGRAFEPRRPVDYLASFDRHTRSVALDDLHQLNA